MREGKTYVGGGNRFQRQHIHFLVNSVGSLNSRSDQLRALEFSDAANNFIVLFQQALESHILSSASSNEVENFLGRSEG